MSNSSEILQILDELGPEDRSKIIKIINAVSKSPNNSDDAAVNFSRTSGFNFETTMNMLTLSFVGKAALARITNIIHQKHQVETRVGPSEINKSLNGSKKKVAELHKVPNNKRPR